MKAFEGFKSEKSSKTPMLPAGAYVASIKNLRLDGQDPDVSLILQLEIIEGDWAGYYTRRYQADAANAGFNQGYEAKYKGTYRLQIPNPNNHMRQHPEWDIRAFNDAMFAIEHSNPDVKFNWDTIFEGNFVFLKGKMVGINVREGVYNGNPYTSIGRLEVVDDVRNGRVELMKPRAPRGEAAVGTDASTGFTAIETDELPF